MSLDRILYTCGSSGEKKAHPMFIAQRHPEQELCRVNEIPSLPPPPVQSILGVIYKRTQQGDSYTRRTHA